MLDCCGELELSRERDEFRQSVWSGWSGAGLDVSNSVLSGAGESEIFASAQCLGQVWDLVHEGSMVKIVESCQVGPSFCLGVRKRVALPRAC